MNYRVLFILSCLFIVSCTTTSEVPASSKSASIIQKAVTHHGGQILKKSKVEFTFRGTPYSMTRNSSGFVYDRSITTKDNTAIKDVLNNNIFSYFEDGKKVELSTLFQNRRKNGLNAVIYFVSLPLPLLDPAVRSKYIEKTTLDGTEYHVIQVTFVEEGGGEDHEDKYMYWFRTDNNQLDYLSYRFYVGEGGLRFRTAKNARIVEGITFLDYDNYTYTNIDVPQTELPKLYKENKLTKVSSVEISNIKVIPN